MDHADTDHPYRRFAARALASLLAWTLAFPLHAAQTDISNTPIVSTTPALVKPNIMLLMDTSGSMARTHMPDEVETLTGRGSVGYKSSQCNALYYNPATTYFLPKRYDGTSFSPPSFSAAPYAGFGSFYVPADTHAPVDLRSGFQAYDLTTLEVGSGLPDTAQPAYYYVHTGTPATLSYANAPCTDGDTGATRASSTGGTWTKVIVGAAEQQNFANWYSYYRTRLSLVKSAASLAFAPLDANKRVGFITVEPKDQRTDTSINPIRFLPIDDFDPAAGAQKEQWFAKLFSQNAKGASPAREGLARVGRHYAGREDSINSGMSVTGNLPNGHPRDPVQYACQQNFTILTTDGYWNGQTETPDGSGLFGGGLQIDGQTKVGQQDGDPTCPLSDPYCPRPIFDGVAGSTRKVTDKTNAYTDNVCSRVGGRFRDTTQTTQRTFVERRDTRKQQAQTVQYFESKTQTEKLTREAVATYATYTQVVNQFAYEKRNRTEERYQHVKWTEQTTKVTEQYRLQTTQLAKQTFQTRKVEKQTSRHDEQWTMASTQYVQSTTQYVQEKAQFQQEVKQTIKARYQDIAYDLRFERGDPVEGACTPSPGNYPIECRVFVVEASHFDDPAACVADSVGTAPYYIKTTCTPGAAASPNQAVASCTPGTTNSGSPNYIVTTCTRVVLTPAAAINTTCAAGTTQTGAPDYFVYTCTLPAVNNTSGGVSSCTPGSVSSGNPDYITTSCVQPAATNYAARAAPACTPGTNTDASFITTTCVKTVDTTSYATACTNDLGNTGPSYLKTTCNTVTLTDTPIDPASCNAGNTGNPSFIVTTCPRAPIAPYAAETPTDVCNGGVDGSLIETVCSNPPGANNTTAFVASCTVGTTPGTSPNWVTQVCDKPAGPNNDTAYSPPCSSVGGGPPNYIRTTCTTAPLTTPVVVDPSVECGTFGVTVGPGPGYIVTHCDKQPVSSGPVPTCSNPANSGPPNFIITVCGNGYVLEPVASCTVGSTFNTGPPDYYDVTCVKPYDNATTEVPACSNQNPLVGNGYVSIACTRNIRLQHYLFDGQCFGGPYYQNNLGYTSELTCSGFTVVSNWAPAASCSPGFDGSHYVSECRSGAATVASHGVAPCTPGSTTDANFVTTTCTKSDVTDWVPPGCVDSDNLASGGSKVTCLAPVVATGVAGPPGCSMGAVDATSPYEQTTGCNTEETSGGFVDYAGVCAPSGGSAPGWVQVQCGSRVLATHVADGACTPGTSTDPSTGVTTTCYNESGGNGHLYTVQTTTTVTTTPYSGTAAAGPPSVVTSTGPLTNVDGQCHEFPQTIPSAAFPAKPPVDVALCSAWPCTETTVSAGGSQNSLADVASYYYKTDLRPSMPDAVPAAGTGAEDDKAPHQHMTTFTLALGVSGTLNYRTDYRSLATTTGDFADIRTGARNWPLWPDPLVDYTNANNYNNAKSIDDFWHTAVNGRGRYFSANDPRSVIDGLGDALSSIDIKVASGAPDAVSSLEPTNGNNFQYATSYVSGSWSGDLQAYDINVGDGSLSPVKWSAQALLDGRTFNACDNRKILLFRNGSTLVDFTWNTDVCPTGTPTGSPVTSLNATEQSFLNALNISLLSQYPFMTDGSGGTAMQQQAAVQAGNLVNFLRGQRGNENYVSNSTTKLWRKRDHVLGDLVDSQPVYVKAPFANYSDLGYSGFKSTNSTRRAMVYVGGNDGMLHAFNATTDLTDPLHGQEAWAVIPSAVLPNLYKLADVNYARTGHQFFVDGSPVAGDVCGGACATPSDWKTILVGGLNAGGKGYYALDVTDPTSPPTPLWEFKQNPTLCPASPSSAVGNLGDCNLGLTFGKPVITKLAGTWVVMVTSGYNNVNGASNGADGGGFLYVLNALSGAIIAKIPTEVSGANVGDSATPSGLAQINNYVADALLDNTTQRAYGTDLLGNVWRFEFSPNAATLVGTVKDASNNPQPITVRPELAELNGKPFVMVGTGKLLGASDIPLPQQGQSIWGFADPLTTTSPVYGDLRGALKPLRMTQVGTGATAVRTVACSSGSAVDCSRAAGWVVDLPEAGERVNVEMKLAVGTLVVATNVPQPIPCSVGGHSWINFFDFRTGLAVVTAPNSVIGNPSSDRIVSSVLGADSLNVGFNVVRLPPPSGGVNGTYVGGARQSSGGFANFTPPISDPPPLGRRISWREIAR